MFFSCLNGFDWMVKSCLYMTGGWMHGFKVGLVSTGTYGNANRHLSRGILHLGSKKRVDVTQKVQSFQKQVI